MHRGGILILGIHWNVYPKQTQPRCHTVSFCCIDHALLIALYKKLGFPVFLLKIKFMILQISLIFPIDTCDFLPSCFAINEVK